MSYFDQVVNLIKNNKLPGPVVPDMLAKVVRLTMKANVSFGELSNFCGQHQALSAKLLSFVNSAFYSHGADRISNLEVAVTRIGLRETSSIMHAVATRSYLVGKDAVLRKLILDNLETAFVVAMAAQALAKTDKYKKIDAVYTVGLFHNIGWTFFLYTLGLLQDKGEAGSVDSDSLKSVGRKRGAELNSILSREMGLPEDIVAALLLPDPASPDTLRVVGYVHRAMWCAERLLENRRVEDIVFDTEAEVLGATARDIETMVAQAPGWLALVETYATR